MPYTPGFANDTGQRLLGLPQGSITGLPDAEQAMQVATAPSLLTGRSPDISNWDNWTFDAACFKANGVERAIVGTQYPAIAQRQLAGLRSVGIPAHVYAFLYFGSSQPERTTEESIAIAREFDLPVVWLDAEADAPGVNPTPASRNAQLARCVKLVEDAGLVCGLYTAAWWWVPQHGNTTQFARLPLWMANYGRNDCTLAPIRNVAFGGWTHCVIHQYCSTDGFCGRDVRDANYVWADAPAFGEDSEMGMTPEEKAAFAKLQADLAATTQLVSNLANIVVRNGIDLTGDGEVDMTGDAALAYAIDNGWSSFFGVSLARQQASRAEALVVKHVVNHPSSGGLPPHTHETGPAIPVPEES